MPVEEPAVTVRVVTYAPLLRLGLERAATAAGFAVVHGGDRAAVTLRPDDLEDQDTDAVDVSVRRDRVVVTVRRTVDVATALALQRLVKELLEPT